MADPLPIHKALAGTFEAAGLGRLVIVTRDGPSPSFAAPAWLVALEAHFSSAVEARSSLRGASISRAMVPFLNKLEPFADELAVSYALGDTEGMLKTAACLVLDAEARGPDG